MQLRASDKPTSEELLSWPAFSREQWTAFLYRPYSLKERRSLVIYGHPSFSLWTRLETDPQVLRLNFQVPTISLAVDGTVQSASPAAVSLSRDKNLTVHVLADDPDDSAAPAGSSLLGSWRDWCKRQGFELRSWTPTLLWRNAVHAANLEELLRRTSASGQIVNHEVQALLLDRLRFDRKMTIRRLLTELASIDYEELVTAAFCLIHDRRVESDIENKRLSMLTTLSLPNKGG